jgi:hypothetical protein
MLLAVLLSAVAAALAGALTGGDRPRVAAVVLLLAGPFVALLRLTAALARHRPLLVAYTVGTLAVTALGVWLAR